MQKLLEAHNNNTFLCSSYTFVFEHKMYRVEKLAIPTFKLPPTCNNIQNLKMSVGGYFKNWCDVLSYAYIFEILKRSNFEHFQNKLPVELWTRRREQKFTHISK